MEKKVKNKDEVPFLMRSRYKIKIIFAKLLWKLILIVVLIGGSALVYSLTFSIVSGIFIVLLLNQSIQIVTTEINIRSDGVEEIKHGVFISFKKIAITKRVLYLYEADLYIFQFLNRLEPVGFEETTDILLYIYPFNGQSLRLCNSYTRWDGMERTIYANMKKLGWEFVLESTTQLLVRTLERKYFKDPLNPDKHL